MNPRSCDLAPQHRVLRKIRTHRVAPSRRRRLSSYQARILSPTAPPAAHLKHTSLRRNATTALGLCFPVTARHLSSFARALRCPVAKAKISDRAPFTRNPALSLSPDIGPLLFNSCSRNDQEVNIRHGPQRREFHSTAGASACDEWEREFQRTPAAIYDSRSDRPQCLQGQRSTEPWRPANLPRTDQALPSKPYSRGSRYYMRRFHHYCRRRGFRCLLPRKSICFGLFEGPSHSLPRCAQDHLSTKALSTISRATFSRPHWRRWTACLYLVVSEAFGPVGPREYPGCSWRCAELIDYMP